MDKRISYLVWGAPGSVETTAQPQLRGNAAEIRQERQQQDHQADQKRKSWEIAVQGYHQRLLPNFLVSMDNDNNAEAIQLSLDIAERAYAALQQRSKKLASSPL